MEGDRVMRYLSVCSGIEAASAAWMPLGWRPVAFSEIEPFPTSVLAHHHPGVPNWGDMTKYKEWPDEPIDLLCGGTPCQSFSVAGLRKGLADPRGNLMLTFGAIAARYRPRWLVWENVPGVLSSNGGRDFGTFLGLLGVLGYGFAYRVLDAQYFGVAQRRRRVFVVGCLGDWRSAAAVLFERHSMSGHPAPSRKAGQVAPTIPSRSTAGGGLGTDFDCDGGVITMANGQGGEGFDASEDGTGRGTPLVPMFLHANKGRPAGRQSAHTEMVSVKPIVETLTTDGHAQSAVAVPVGVTIHGTDPTVQKVASYDELAQCLRARTPGNIDNSSTTVVQQPVAYRIRTAHTSANGWGIQEEHTHTLDCAQGVAVAQPVAFSSKDYGADATNDLAPTLRAMNHAESHANGGGQMAVAQAMQVRRLTPTEAERLMGFPDGYTAIPWRNKPASECPDGPRYKSLGNSWAVPVARWIGERIEAVEAIAQQKVEAA